MIDDVLDQVPGGARILTDEGWRTVAGDPPIRTRRSTARDAVTERTEAFDPFEPMLGPR